MRAAFLALLSLPAVALPASADKCVSSLTYQEKGGDLDKLAIPEEVPDDVERCTLPACRVEADIKMVVDKDGSARDVVVTMADDASARSDGRAEALRSWLSNLRFEPPKLGVKRVCVSLEWSFWFAQKKSKSTNTP